MSKDRRKNLASRGTYIIIGIALVPVLLWLFAAKAVSPLSSVAAFSAALGEVTGLVGMVLFAIGLVLSARLSFVEKLLYGLTTVYTKHGIIGQIGFILILLHPLFLIPRYATTISEAASFLFFSDNWPRNFGVLALLGTIFLIVLTLYLRPKYNLWKMTHKWMGLAFFLGALHAYLIPAFVMQNIPLKAYVFVISIVGLIAFGYHTLFGAVTTRRSKYRVHGIHRHSSTVVEILLRPEDASQKIEHKAGQFLFISFLQDGIEKTSHPFSISSSPKASTLSIAVKRLGDFTATIHTKLQLGTQVKIEAPFGVFSYSDVTNKRQIWIAGGIGVTPFLSMARELKNIQSDYKIDLYYSVVSARDAVFLRELQEVEHHTKHALRVIPFCSDKSGYLTVEYIQAHTEKYEEREIFLCAPIGMIRALRDDFVRRGFKKECIHSEEFNV